MSNRNIEKTTDGYVYRSPNEHIAYKQIGNEIHVGKSYIIRNLGNVIEILTNGLFNKEYLRFRIIKSVAGIHVFNRRCQVLEIIKTSQELTVSKNARNRCSYVLK
jgi:hypothetical protein